jgi:hypothetical protein
MGLMNRAPQVSSQRIETPLALLFLLDHLGDDVDEVRVAERVRALKREVDVFRVEGDELVEDGGLADAGAATQIDRDHPLHKDVGDLENLAVLWKDERVGMPADAFTNLCTRKIIVQNVPQISWFKRANESRVSHLRVNLLIHSQI